ncbi:hypothetical protein ACQ4LE_005260 [Meloidogyne hapla]
MFKIPKTFVFIFLCNFYQIIVIQSTGNNSPTEASSSSGAGPSTYLAIKETEKYGLQIVSELAEIERIKEEENKSKFFDLLALEIWKKGIRIVFGVDEKENKIKAFMNLKLLKKLTNFKNIEICGDETNEIQEKMLKLNIFDDEEEVKREKEEKEVKELKQEKELNSFLLKNKQCLNINSIVENCIKKLKIKIVKLKSTDIASKVKSFFEEEKCQCHRKQSLKHARAKIIDGMHLFVFKRKVKDDDGALSHGGTSKIYHAYYYKDPEISQIESIEEEKSFKGKLSISQEDKGKKTNSDLEDTEKNNKIIELPLKSKCVALKIAKMEIADDKEINPKLFKNEEKVLKHFASKYKQSGGNKQCHILRIFASQTENIKHPKLVLELAERSLENYWNEQKINKHEHPSTIKKILKEMLIVLEQFHLGKSIKL